MELDQKTIDALKSLAPIFQVPPPPVTGQVKDADSFASLTTNVRNNWPIILALASLLFWGFNLLSNINAVNADQDRRITTNAQDIGKLADTVADYARTTDTRLDNASSNDNDIIRRLDSLAKDIEIIKGNK